MQSITLTRKEAEDIVLGLEKAYRMLEEEGFNEKSMILIYKGRKLMREILNIQRIKCNIPNDVAVIYKDKNNNAIALRKSPNL